MIFSLKIKKKRKTQQGFETKIGIHFNENDQSGIMHSTQVARERKKW